MPESPNGEKTEDPTPKRIQDARDEGNVAYSTDVMSALLLLVGMSILAVSAPWFIEGIAASMRAAVRGISDVGQGLRFELDGDWGPWEAFLSTMLPLVLWGAGICVTLWVVCIIGSVMQVGFYLSGKALLPKMSKISPITGFGRIFGLRGLMRTVTGLLKIILVMAVAWMVLARDVPRLASFAEDPVRRLATDSWLIYLLAMKLTMVIVIVAFIDFLYQRFQHWRDLRMTKQEVKEEMKQSEGDPLIKAKVRQIQRQMAQRRMMAEVPKADVVITNPTHVAVALQYDREKMAAPVVLAKGYDDVAQRIKAIASEHGIPLVEDVPLARALAKDVPVGKAIPIKWYQAVAEVLGRIYQLKRGAK
jgi:flagellar biosynthetic protein FlhB